MRQLIATLRHRPAALVGIFVALVVASSVITWAFALGLSPNGSSTPVERLANAAVVVSGKPNVAVPSGNGANASTGTVPLTSYRPVPADLATRLSKVPGVRAAVADKAVVLALQLHGGRVLTLTGTPAQPVTAYGWPSAELTPFRLRSGHAPAGPRQLVLGAGLAQTAHLGVGDRVRLVGEPLSSFTVVGTASAPAGDPVEDGAVFLSLSEVDALSGQSGRADLIGVVAKSGVSPTVLAARVRSVLTDQHLLIATGTSRGGIEDLEAASEFSNLGQLGGGTAPTFVLVSLFVVASTVALSVAERSRAMALLRAIGATPGQVRRLVMVELATLGVLGGLAGYPLGAWLASFSVRGLAAHQFVPSSARPWVSPLGLIPAVGAGVIVAELAGLFAARRASRTRPTTALAEATVERRAPRLPRLVLGLGALGAGMAETVAVLREHSVDQQIVDAQLALLAFMATIAFLGPYLVVVAELCLRFPSRALGGVAGRLASAELRGRSRRMAAAVVAIALPVCFTLAITSADATQTHASVTESQQRLAATVAMSAPGPGLDPSVLAMVRSRPGVRGAVGLVPTTVYVPGFDSASGEGVTTGPFSSLVHLDVTSGCLAGFGPGDLALSTLLAGAIDAQIGQAITVYLADATPYRARVTALFSRSLGFADVVVPTSAAGGGHLGSEDLGTVLVDTVPSVDHATEFSSVRAAYPGLEIASRTVANAQYDLATDQTSYVNNLLLALIGLLAGVALVNTLVMATLQGRDELGLLGRLGATNGQLMASTGVRSLQVVLLGLLIGVAATVVAVVAVAKALTGSWAPTIPWGSVGVVLALVVCCTFVATVAPTVRMLRIGLVSSLD